MCMNRLVILSTEWKTRAFENAMTANAIGPFTSENTTVNRALLSGHTHRYSSKAALQK